MLRHIPRRYSMKSEEGVLVQGRAGYGGGGGRVCMHENSWTGG